LPESFTGSCAHIRPQHIRTEEAFSATAERAFPFEDVFDPEQHAALLDKQKPLTLLAYRGFVDLVAGTGFEPVTFRL
jgi:hypothetical protein